MYGALEMLRVRDLVVLNGFGTSILAAFRRLPDRSSRC